MSKQTRTIRGIMKAVIITIYIFFVSSIFCYAQPSYSYGIPPTIDDGWNTKDIREIIPDTTLLYTFFNQLQSGKHKLHSSLVIKDDNIIVEEYFDKHTINTRHDMRSATKSIISILMGIAIDKGFVDSIDDPVLKYIKQPIPQKNLDPRKEKITIRHLLTMSTGLDCNDWDKKSKGQEDKVYRKEDWLQFTLDLPMCHDPGIVSSYCSMGTVLAAEVITQASGVSFDTFANTYLFDILGIKNMNWGHTSKRKDILPSAKRLYMTPRDMAKIGKLILQKGTWNTEQVVSQEWIAQSTKPQTQLAGREYGFLWWKFPFKVDQNKIIGTIASGNGGQYIMIFEEKNVIAVFTGGAYNSREGKLPYAVVNNVYLPILLNAN